MNCNITNGVRGLYQIYNALSLIRSAERVTDKPGGEEYRNIPAAFDIETTQTEHGAYMYVWQVAIGWYPENYSILTGPGTNCRARLKQYEPSPNGQRLSFTFITCHMNIASCAV